MTKLQDAICKLRDFFENNDIYYISKKLPYQRALIQLVFTYVHKRLGKRAEEYETVKFEKDFNVKEELDFTSQDLRELAQDIRNVFKKWETEMNPEKNIKALKKQITENGQLNFHDFTEQKTIIMIARRNFVQPMLELLNMLEFYGVYLYYLEIASKDEFAVKCTERL